MRHKSLSFSGENDPDAPAANVAEISGSYYERVLALCEQRGIEVMAITPPTAKTGGDIVIWKANQAFCDEHGITYLNYNLPEMRSEIGLDPRTDYYDSGHLNALGSVKLSNSLAKRLSQEFGLPDRRQDERYNQWNVDYQQYWQDYSEWMQQLVDSIN